MSTEFKVSTKIIFWGDQLQPSFLLNTMELDQEFCKLQLLGEEILRKNGESTGGIAKTSRLSFAHNYQFPDDSRNPEKQFNFILSKLKNIKRHLNEGFNVDAAELQISLYYSEPLEGEVDFFIPRELQAELLKHNIDIRITALP